MKGMPLPFDFEGKGVVHQQLVHSALWEVNNTTKKRTSSFFSGGGGGGSEPNSVLDNISPSPTNSTSTLSSSLHGGGGGGGSCSTDTAALAAVSKKSSQKWPPEKQENTSGDFAPPPPASAAGEKCGLVMEDWESVLSENVTALPNTQENSILKWIMGDVEDPSMGLNKVLQMGSAVGGGGVSPPEFDFSGGFGVVDQGFGLDGSSTNGGANSSTNPLAQVSNFGGGGGANFMPFEKIGLAPPNPQNPMFFQESSVPFDAKPQVFGSQMLINQHQAHTPPQNPAFFMPLPYPQHEQMLMPPNPKRHNPGSAEHNTQNPQNPRGPFLDPGQLLPHYLQQRPAMANSKKMAVEDELGQTFQQGIIDQLFKAADLVQSGNNPVHAQGILARLNHQLSPIGKPFNRAAFYFKEALQLLVHSIVNNVNLPASSISSPFSLIYKIGAYKSFSEISPFIQFANFTCNQALLELLNGYDQIHVIDFDIGYGGQWASLMQELALRSKGAPSLKITAFASPSTCDQLELGLTRENLNHFASELNMAFEFEIVNLDVIASSSWAVPMHVSEMEAIAVNLPVGSASSHQIPLALVLRFVKSISPKIVVSVDRGCDRTDLPFPNHVIHALQSYSNLLESLDAVNVNPDALQKIERFLLHPSIEKIVTGRYHFPEKTQHWRTLFLSSGFSPLTFSNFTESQAECLVKRTPVRGFHVEKRQSSLVLCWQRRELVSASAWRC